MHGDLDHRGGAVVLYLLDRVVIGEVQGGRGMKARENCMRGREGGREGKEEEREGERERGRQSNKLNMYPAAKQGTYLVSKEYKYHNSQPIMEAIQTHNLITNRASRPTE